uniref:MSP domain-containing protein n=1 Tax=Caenorhabditis tropicalis TaxID=1561998 RepID=A0A1I7TVH8_9PELO
MSSGFNISDVYREGRPSLLVPVNGIQLFEITNLDSNVRKIIVLLNSVRFFMLDSRKTGYNSYTFDAVLKPKGSIVFALMDKGHIEEDNYEISTPFEGNFQYSISKDPYVEGKKPEQYNLPELLVNLNPETNSYREFYRNYERLADCVFKKYEPDPMEKLLKIEPISKENTEGSQWKRKWVYVDETAKKDYANGFHFDGSTRIREASRGTGGRMGKIIEEKVRYFQIRNIESFVKIDIRNNQIQLEISLNHSKIQNLGGGKSVEKSVVSKSMTKSIQNTPKSMESQRTDPSKHSEYIRKPDEGVVIQNTLQEEEGKKKKKKKKKCVIS